MQIWLAAKFEWFLDLLHKRLLGQEIHLMFKYVLDAATLRFTFRVVSAHVSYQIKNVIISSNY
jgi:hypothetical protein